MWHPEFPEMKAEVVVVAVSFFLSLFEAGGFQTVVGPFTGDGPANEAARAEDVDMIDLGSDIDDDDDDAW